MKLGLRFTPRLVPTTLGIRRYHHVAYRAGTISYHKLRSILGVLKSSRISMEI